MQQRRQYLLAAASNARAAWKKKVHSRSTPSPLEENQHHNHSVPQTQHADGIESGEESECGYKGSIIPSVPMTSLYLDLSGNLRVDQNGIQNCPRLQFEGLQVTQMHSRAGGKAI